MIATRHARWMVGVLGTLATLAIAPAGAHAQRYQLRLAPVPGDTLRMELEQSTDVVSEARPDMPERTMKAQFRVFSHAIVSGRLKDATILIARTDSVRLDSGGERGNALAEQARRMTGTEPVTLRLAPDGTVRVVDGAGNVGAEAAETVSLIPAALPQGLLSIGDTWTRSMPVPVGPSADAGTVRATFRFDSVSANGRTAYLSIRGDLARDDMPAAGPRGTMMSVVGTVMGTLQLDRVRGWIAESRFVVTMHSALQPPAASGMSPMKFKTVVTQRVRLARPASRRRAAP